MYTAKQHLIRMNILDPGPPPSFFLHLHTYSIHSVIVVLTILLQKQGFSYGIIKRRPCEARPKGALLCQLSP